MNSSIMSTIQVDTEGGNYGSSIVLDNKRLVKEDIRRKHQDKISKENRMLLTRLQNSTGYYSIHKWEESEH